MVDREQLWALVEQTAQASDFSGVLQVDRGDETVVAFASGLADRRHAVANSSSTRFGTASATKGFTALAVMSLVDDGVLDLDQPVRGLLGHDLPEVDDAVTVRNLLAHRSGIGDYLDEEADGDINDYVMPIPVHELSSAESYLRVLRGFPQREQPDELFRYNNSGYVVLAIVAERAADKPYHDLVHERVVGPAGLTSTSFERGDALPGDVATGYLHPTGLTTNVLHLPVIGVGDGGIATTAADMHRLWGSLFADRIVPTELRRAMIEPVSQNTGNRERYGLGFWLHPTSDAVILEGMDAGVSFRSVHEPVGRLSMTVISNTSTGAWPLAKALEEALSLN